MQHQEARERHIEAAKKHPDMDEKEAAEQFDREHASTGGAGAAGAGAAGGGAVEHHEHTSTPSTEHERRFERNEQGEVVRDEEYEEPRR